MIEARWTAFCGSVNLNLYGIKGEMIPQLLICILVLLLPCPSFAATHRFTLNGTGVEDSDKEWSPQGSPCKSDSECAQVTSLTCQNEICECSRPDSMIFDEVEQRCLVSAGKPCRFEIGENENRGESRPRPGNPSGMQFIHYDFEECTPGTFCSDVSNNCECLGGDSFASGGKCKKYKRVGESCDQESNICNPNNLLICENSTCACDPGLSMENPDSTACLCYVGSPCANSCVERAHCDPEKEVCTCDSEYLPASDGGKFCDTKDYDWPCAIGPDEIKCNSRFTCMEGYCRCRYDDQHQYYDFGMRTCRSLVRGPCELDVGPPTQCTDNAECVLNPRTNLGECKCLQNFMVGGDGKCDSLAFGTICEGENIGSSLTQSYNGSMSPHAGPPLRCDQRVPLFCRDGMCNCKDDGKIFESRLNRCRKAVGSFCDGDHECVDNAICRIPNRAWYSYDDRGQCECSKPELQTPDRKCSGA